MITRVPEESNKTCAASVILHNNESGRGERDFRAGVAYIHVYAFMTASEWFTAGETEAERDADRGSTLR